MAEIDLIQQRIAETHARFRQANEQIEAAAHTLGRRRKGALYLRVR